MKSGGSPERIGQALMTYSLHVKPEHLKGELQDLSLIHI